MMDFLTYLIAIKTFYKIEMRIAFIKVKEQISYNRKK